MKQRERNQKVIAITTAITVLGSTIVANTEEVDGIQHFFNSMGQGAFSPMTILCIAGVVIVFILASFLYERLGFNGSNAKLKNNTKELTIKVQQSDPSFSVEEWMEFVQTLFTKYLMNYAKEDLFDTDIHLATKLREAQYDQINANMIKDRAKVIDNIVIRFCEIAAYDKYDQHACIQMHMKALYKEYVICKSSKKLIEGNPERVHVGKFKLVFERKNSKEAPWILTVIEAI